MFINRTISRACGPGHWPRLGARGVGGAEFIIRRLGVIVAAGALLGMSAGMLAASPALAGRGPQWQLVPETPFTVPAAICGFKVGVAFPVVKTYGKLLKAADGSVITLGSGSLQASYTNLSTGTAVTEHISGPTRTHINPDGSGFAAFKGRNGLFLTPAQAQQFGLPALAVTAGPVQVSFNAAGTVTGITLSGHVLVDICAALS
jgi:hypothetical protein